MVFDPLLYLNRHTAGDVLPEANADEEHNLISQKELEIVNLIRSHLRMQHGAELSAMVIDPSLRQRMEKEILLYMKENKIVLPEMDQPRLFERVKQEILYFGPIQSALDDPSVTNIDINCYKDVYVERGGIEEYHPEMGFHSQSHLEIILNRMLMNNGKVLTAHEPHIDSLFESYRICAVLGCDRGGIASEGTCASIRKFSEEIVSPEDMLQLGTISQEMYAFFREVLPWCNVVIAGATNSGKTTTLMSLPFYFEPDTRIITIEDSPELMLRRRRPYRDYKNIVALQGKEHENKDKIFDIARLTKVSLRLRPVKIIIGEVRDAQACRQAHESMNTGHSTYFTIHASSARNAAMRIVQLAGDGYNDEVIASQLADTVDLILFQQKIGKRRIVTEVVELEGYMGAKKPICRTLFRFQPDPSAKELEKSGQHECVKGITRALAEKLESMMVNASVIGKWHDFKEGGS